MDVVMNYRGCVVHCFNFFVCCNYLMQVPFLCILVTFKVIAI